MTAFDTDFAAEALPGLLDEHGEDIIYTPRGGAPRTITAIVDRNPPVTIDCISETVAARFVILLESHATRGILTSGIDTGGDLVTLAERKGATAADFPITKVLNEDGGCIEFEVR